MRRCVTIVAIVALAMFVDQQHAVAQGFQGGSGNRTFGGNVSGSNRTMFSPTAGIGQSMETNVGEIESSDRFLRGNRQAGSFVGAGGEDTQSFVGSEQADGGGPAGRTNRSARGAGGRNRAATANQGRGNRGGRGRTYEIRSVLMLGFSPPRPMATKVTETLTARLAKIGRGRTASSFEVAFRQGTAVLRGTAATDHDRDLVEQLTRLEPGIWNVDNQIVVVASGNRSRSSAAGPATLPTAAPLAEELPREE